MRFYKKKKKKISLLQNRDKGEEKILSQGSFSNS